MVAQRDLFVKIENVISFKYLHGGTEVADMTVPLTKFINILKFI